MNPFDKHVPSVFSIGTPFQALCAIATIRQLEIEDYLFLLNLSSNRERYDQLCTLLEKYDINFKVVNPYNRIRRHYGKWQALRKHKSRFKRLFIGDFRDILLYYTSLGYVADGSSVVYLDDGNVTISLLLETISEPLKEETLSFWNEVKNKRSIDVNKNILTIYEKIDNPKYTIRILDLSILLNCQNEEYYANEVYIVGTNINSYCDFLDISYDIVINEIEKLIKKIKIEYPKDRVIYVPHGRDKSEYAKTLCEKYGVDFEPSEMLIELTLMNKQYPPKAIYGFTSSALFNIKKIYPQTRIVNVFFDFKVVNSGVQEYLMISDYYKKNGIELMIETL